MRSLGLFLLLGLVFGMGCGGAGSVRTTSAPARSSAQGISKPGDAKEGAAKGGPEKVAMMANLKKMAGGKDPVGNDEEAKQQPEVARKIIYTADVDLVVEKFEEAEQRIRDLVKEFKGYISKSEVTGAPGSRRHGRWTARIPVDRFDAFRDAIAGLGELQRNTLDSQDVTEEFYDLEANIKNKQVEEERLREHLKKSTGSLKDILAVEEQLSRVRGEIERQQGRMNYLARLTAMTTVTITVQERKGYVPESSPSFGTSIGRTFEGSLEGLTELGKGIVIVIVALVPWIPVIALVVIPSWLLIRRWWRPATVEVQTVRPGLPGASPPAAPPVSPAG